MDSAAEPAGAIVYKKVGPVMQAFSVDPPSISGITPPGADVDAPVLWTLETGAVQAPGPAHWRAVLDPEERAAADRLHALPHRREAVAAHALRRALLSAETGGAPSAWRFTRDQPLGKPRVDTPGPAPDVSLTHTAGLVAAVVAPRAAVGVDAEHLGRALADESLVSHVLTPAEAASLPAPPGSPERGRAFLRLWVAKEAVAKALGLGLSLPLARMEVLGDPPTVALRPPWPALHPPPALRLLRPTPVHVLAVAVAGTVPGVPALRWRHLDAAALDRALTREVW